MKKIVILTSSELRHTFFRQYISLSKEIQVVNSYCEGQGKSLSVIVDKDDATKYIRLKHLSARARSEEDFFRLFAESTDDQSNPVDLSKGEINTTKYTQLIIDSKPDLANHFGDAKSTEKFISV